MSKKLAFSILSLVIILLAGCGNNDEEGLIKESGTIETTNIIISSQVSGKTARILYDEGEKIKTGDTLMVIDPEDYKIQLQQALAQSEVAGAQYELAKQGARSEDIKQAEENLTQAEANLTLAQDDFNRMENLYKSQSITKKQYDDAAAKLKITKAQYQSAQQNLQKTKNITRPEELTQAKASYESSDAQVKLLQKKVNDCYIISPINGYIVEKFVEIAEFVSPQTSLLKLSDLSEVEVVIYISETDLGKVKLGQKAKVFTDTYPDKEYAGKVTYISPDAEFTPKNIQTKEERTKLVFAVKITVPNASDELKGGMPADAEIEIQ